MQGDRSLLAACVASSLYLYMSCIGAQSLHEKPLGTVVEGSFNLAGKVVPLPEGRFTLAYGGVRTGEILPGARVNSWAAEQAEVVIYKQDGQVLQVVLNARANIGNQSRWSHEPCKREDLLHRLDRAQTHDWAADCFTVNHQLGLLTSPSGIWVQVHDRMKAGGVQIPLPLVLVASYTRIWHAERMSATYYINPVAYGYSADRGANWATSPWNRVRIDSDPSKTAFVRAVVDWGTQMVPLFGQGFEGKPLEGRVPPMDFPRQAAGK